MFLNDYARERGATVTMLTKTWNEWVLKGNKLSAYPMGMPMTIQPPEDIGEPTWDPGLLFMDDIPLEHRAVDYRWFPADAWNAVWDSLFTEPIRPVLLHGKPGKGKSSLAAAIILQLRDWRFREHQANKDTQKRLARFCSQAEFTSRALNTQFLDKKEFGTMLGSRNGATHGSMFINELMEFRGLLVLDDVIHPKAHPSLSSRIIEIINHRHENHLLTIITSNLAPHEIADKLDPAVASRLCGGLVLRSVGEDLRQTKINIKEKENVNV